MADKLIDDKKPKLTRSRARHLRRKRLIIARKEADKKTINIEFTDNNSINNNSNLLSSSATTIESLENNSTPLADSNLTKSKARRLRKKHKKVDNSNELIENKKNLELINDIDKINYNNILIINSNSDNKSINDSLLLSSENDKVDKISLVNEEINEDKNISNEIVDTNIYDSNNKKIIKMNNDSSKTREQIKAEREAKKLAKAVSKNKKNKVLTDNIGGKVLNDDKLELLKDVRNSSLIDQDQLTTDTTDFCHASKEISPVIPSEYIIRKLTIEDKDSNVSKVLGINDSIEINLTSKSQLRAERRAKQEAQRAAKELEKSQKKNVTKKDNSSSSSNSKKAVASTGENVVGIKEEEGTKKIVKKIMTASGVINHEMNLFKHLYHEREQCHVDMPVVNSHLHPAIVRLGVQYKDKVIVGSNARCVAFLSALKQLIYDYERPSQADFTRGLESCFQESMAYLHYCRPLAVSMQNALKHIKWKMTLLPRTTPDDQAKSQLANAIDTYIQEQILLAGEAISMTIRTKISNGDVILTYGYSSLIQRILCDAYDAGRKFRVIIVDGRPWLEGRELLRRLAKHGVECSYILINALSFIMPGVNKVFVGAHAILANGAVMSRAGTAQVALMAKAFNVPVLVACETHKSCERVQTDSIVCNEIGNADELDFNTTGVTKKSPLSNWKAKKTLNLLNIMYDVTPADLVTAVVTELAILPCTSVPVILRIKPSEI
ncbi:translation initiation factor eIF-2B subunit delta [Microplitis mediator]|uniref:translation initiation factor eIF-2B subunit delta n=1 Tax=Microplitis mediator TaxID=375433 RepID=UPI00255612A9|nr:translation initiation factor eIF-2B subunit delta [Microplitis mediator]